MSDNLTVEQALRNLIATTEEMSESFGVDVKPFKTKHQLIENNVICTLTMARAALQSYKHSEDLRLPGDCTPEEIAAHEERVQEIINSAPSKNWGSSVYGSEEYKQGQKEENIRLTKQMADISSKTSEDL